MALWSLAMGYLHHIFARLAHEPALCIHIGEPSTSSVHSKGKHDLHHSSPSLVAIRSNALRTLVTWLATKTSFQSMEYPRQNSRHRSVWNKSILGRSDIKARAHSPVSRSSFGAAHRAPANSSMSMILAGTARPHFVLVNIRQVWCGQPVGGGTPH